jgi:hypothetical protein
MQMMKEGKREGNRRIELRPQHSATATLSLLAGGTHK